MPEQVVQQVSGASVSLVVHRSVPCDQHDTWAEGCPDCLTGAQAEALGVPHAVEDHGSYEGTVGC